MRDILYQLVDCAHIFIFLSFSSPLKAKLLKTTASLSTGIQCVVRANGYIKELADEIARREPDSSKMSGEIDELNKRLGQERLNLDKASKAFR